MAEQITETISTVDEYTVTPSRLSPATFFEDRETRLSEETTRIPQQNTQATEINTLAGQMNTVATEVEANRVLTVDAKDTTLGLSNYKGLWSSLTGALSQPASVKHNGVYWVLETDLADVTASEPSQANSDWSIFAAGLSDTDIKTANYTASAFERVPCDTLTTGAFTLTLPASPNDNDRVAFFDVASNFDTANLTIGRNGNTIMGLAEDMIVGIKNFSGELIYKNNDWRLL